MQTRTNASIGSTFGSIGMTCNTHADVVGNTSAVQAILRFLSISRGQDAWSATRLFDLVQSTHSLFWKMFSDLEHPIAKDWRPKPHLDVLENIGGASTSLEGELYNAGLDVCPLQPYSMDEYRRKKNPRPRGKQWWRTAATSWSALLNEQECKYSKQSALEPHRKQRFLCPKQAKFPETFLL